MLSQRINLIRKCRKQQASGYRSHRPVVIFANGVIPAGDMLDVCRSRDDRRCNRRSMDQELQSAILSGGVSLPKSQGEERREHSVCFWAKQNGLFIMWQCGADIARSGGSTTTNRGVFCDRRCGNIKSGSRAAGALKAYPPSHASRRWNATRGERCHQAGALSQPTILPFLGHAIFSPHTELPQPWTLR
jgi:hypothetical protein